MGGWPYCGRKQCNSSRVAVEEIITFTMYLVPFRPDLKHMEVIGAMQQCHTVTSVRIGVLISRMYCWACESWTSFGPASIIAALGSDVTCSLGFREMSSLGGRLCSVIAFGFLISCWDEYNFSGRNNFVWLMLVAIKQRKTSNKTISTQSVVREGYSIKGWFQFLKDFHQPYKITMDPGLVFSLFLGKLNVLRKSFLY